MVATGIDQGDVEHLLERTSRTFALAIPLLPSSLARPVGLAYLLLRIADELEDAPLWRRDRRARALASFVRWLDAHAAAPETGWAALVSEAAPTHDAGCLELLARADDVLAGARAPGARVGGAIATHVKRTAIGMADFVAHQGDDGSLALASVDDLRRYAYIVAGIVGELLTELFAGEHDGVRAVRAELDVDAAAFGEGLQLVNILKDAPSDAREGRRYLPAGVPRASVVDMARSDLARAQRYVATLEGAGAPPGVVAFCDLPVRLAVATLQRLEAGGAKLERSEVLRIYSEVTSGLAAAHST